MKFRQDIPDIMQTKVCREILIFNKFSRGVDLRNASCIVLATPTLDVNISITNQNIKKARHTFVD